MLIKRKCILLLLLFFLFASCVFGQSLKGRVIDKTTREGIPFATLSLVDKYFSQTSLVSTDLEGNFEINQDNVDSLKIITSYLGYQNDTTTLSLIDNELNHQISLKQISFILDNVTIKSQKALFKIEKGKLIFNVENINSGQSDNLSEIISKTPSVSLDQSGNILFRGKQGVAIQINGRPLNISSDQLLDYLSSIPGSLVEKIELIATPNASQEASGSAGIINIKLKQRDDLGLNGNMNAGIAIGRFPRFNFGSNANYRINEYFNIYGGYSKYKGKNYLINNSFRTVLNNTQFIQNGETENTFNNSNYQFGIDVNKNNHEISVFSNAVSSVPEYLSLSTTDILTSQIDSIILFRSENERKLNNITLTYKHKYNIDTSGSYVEANLDYYPSSFKSETSQNTSHFLNDGSIYRPDFIEKFEAPSTIAVYAASLDLNKNYGDNTFEAGWKSSFVNSDNEILFYYQKENEWINQKNRSNKFIFDETIHAAYIGYTTYYKGIEIYGGIRAESSISKGNSVTIDSVFTRKIFKLFPSMSISKNYTNSSISFSYSKRIDRPVYNQLNPFVYFIDRFSFWQGNVNLRPMITNSFDLSYVFNNWFTASLNYNRSTDVFNQLPIQNDADGTIFNTLQNIGVSNYLGVSVTSNNTITNYWSSYNSFGYYYNEIKDNRNSSVTGIVKGTQFYLNSFNTFTLPKDFNIEVAGQYYSPVVSFWEIQEYFNVNFSISKKISSKSKLTISIRDIFNSTVYNSKIDYQNLDIQSYYKPETRFIGVYYSLSFGKPKAKVTKERKTGIDDEKRRITF